MKEDELLIESLKTGKESAYRELFFRHFEPLTYFAHKYLGDMDAAKDIVQEVFAILYEKRNELDINISVKSYLYRAVANRSINNVNSHKLHARHHEEIKASQNFLSEDTSVEINELEFRINKVIDTLPEQCQLVFKLSRFEQKSNTEIAQMLGISKRTVETHISKALKTLRISLKIIILEFFMKFFT